MSAAVAFSIPGSGRALAEASDAELRDCAERDRQAIATILADAGATPDADGMAPADWIEAAAKRPAERNNLAVIERASRRIDAIRAELKAREAARIEDRARKQAAARAGLEDILRDAPDTAAELRQLGEQVAAAWERLRRWQADVELVGGAGHLGEMLATVQQGAATAAQALGKPAPAVPDLPAGMPSGTDVQRLLAILAGARGGFDRIGRAGKAHRAGELARQLRE
jgi:hypothetical protein